MAGDGLPGFRYVDTSTMTPTGPDGPFAGDELGELLTGGRGKAELAAQAAAGGTAVAGLVLMALGTGVGEAAVIELAAGVFALLSRP